MPILYNVAAQGDILDDNEYGRFEVAVCQKVHVCCEPDPVKYKNKKLLNHNAEPQTS